MAEEGAVSEIVCCVYQAGQTHVEKEAPKGVRICMKILGISDTKNF
jgi:hypothetical protein